MIGDTPKAFRTAAFLSVAIVIPAGGCRHRSLPPENATTDSSEASQVSQVLIGKQITIQGKFSLRGKVGPFIWQDHQPAVYLVHSGSFTWGKPYSEMEGKLVTATGVLRFYHEPDAKPTAVAVQHVLDFFYFDVETAQLRLLSP